MHISTVLWMQCPCTACSLNLVLIPLAKTRQNTALNCEKLW